MVLHDNYGNSVAIVVTILHWPYSYLTYYTHIFSVECFLSRRTLNSTFSSKQLISINFIHKTVLCSGDNVTDLIKNLLLYNADNICVERFQFVDFAFIIRWQGNTVRTMDVGAWVVFCVWMYVCLVHVCGYQCNSPTNAATANIPKGMPMDIFDSVVSSYLHLF